MEVAEIIAAAMKPTKRIECADCLHYVKSSLGPQFAQCHNPESFGVRNTQFGITWAILERKNYEMLGTCGPGARFFDPKPPRRWWEFWK